MSPTPIIRASEIGQYEFCARAWWLSRVKGYPSSHAVAMADGRNAHWQHGLLVQRAGRVRILGWALLVAAGLMALVAIYLVGKGL